MNLIIAKYQIFAEVLVNQTFARFAHVIGSTENENRKISAAHPLVGTLGSDLLNFNFRLVKINDIC